MENINKLLFERIYSSNAADFFIRNQQSEQNISKTTNPDAQFTLS